MNQTQLDEVTRNFDQKDKIITAIIIAFMLGVDMKRKPTESQITNTVDFVLRNTGLDS